MTKFLFNTINVLLGRLVVSQPRNSSCFRRDLDKQEIAIARLLPKNTFDFKHD